MISRNNDFGLLILRLSIGILMLFHGIDKIIYGIGGIQGMLEGKGIPGFIALGVYVGEILAPLLIVFGYRTRLAALVFAVNMLIATLLAHSSDLLQLTKNGGWAVELQALYFFGALALVFTGAGKFSFSFNSKWD